VGGRTRSLRRARLRVRRRPHTGSKGGACDGIPKTRTQPPKGLGTASSMDGVSSLGSSLGNIKYIAYIYISVADGAGRAGHLGLARRLPPRRPRRRARRLARGRRHRRRRPRAPAVRARARRLGGAPDAAGRRALREVQSTTWYRCNDVVCHARAYKEGSESRLSTTSTQRGRPPTVVAGDDARSAKAACSSTTSCGRSARNSTARRRPR
jgi:hypothetical protein